MIATAHESLARRLVRRFAWILLAFLIAPVLIAIPVSLTRETYLTLPWSGLSLRHYSAIFTSPAWISSFLQSIGIGLASTAIATMLGTLSAIGLWRVSSMWGELVRAILLLPLVIPSIIAAMLLYREFVPLGLIDTYVGLILAHGVLASPFVLITVSTSLAGFNRSLDQASRSLGASPTQTMFRVIFPSIKPGILAGVVFAFIASWDELVVTLFISKFAIYTLPRRMWNGIRENTDPTVAAAAVVLLGVTLLAFVIWSVAWRRIRQSEATIRNIPAAE